MKCQTCKGKGRVIKRSEVIICPTCKGQGEVQGYPSIQGSGISYKPIAENLQEGLKDLNIRQNIPHIVIGKQTKSGIPKNEAENVQSSGFTKKEEEIISKVRKWALIIGVLAVVGYAGYRILILFF